MNWDAIAGKAAEPVLGHQRIGPGRNPLKHLEALGVPVRYRRGQTIYEENSAVDYWCRVVSGAARRFSLRVSGRRQIVDLLLANDVFGFGARGRHRFGADAVADGTVIARYPRARLESLASSDVRVAQQLHEAFTEAMTRLQTQILTLGRTTAEAKVGCFILSMAERLSADPTDGVLLPISREDIADYLALSVETVSRSLTQLKCRGVIRLLGTRRMKIVDRDAIEEADRFTLDEDSRFSDGWLNGRSEPVGSSFAKFRG
jgi:CRP-like cAMP-binding protein